MTRQDSRTTVSAIPLIIIVDLADLPGTSFFLLRRATWNFTESQSLFKSITFFSSDLSQLLEFKEQNSGLPWWRSG